MENKEVVFIANDPDKQEEIDLLVRELKLMGHSDKSITIIGEHSKLFTTKLVEEKSKSV